MNQAIIFPIVFLFSILKHDFTLSDISNIASSFQSRLINLHFPSYTYGYSRREMAEFCDKIKNTELFISQSFLPSFSLMQTSYKLFKKLLSFLQTVLLYVGKLHSWSVDENLYKFFSPHCRVKFASYHLFGSANRASAFASSLSSFILWLCRCVCGGNLLRSAWACW